jgi:dUTP pyrophosphatase
MKISKIRDVKTPVRGTEKSAGIDFFVPDDVTPFHVNPRESACIPSGIKANVPPGFVLIVFNKSGVALKRSLAVGACVIDEDYQGEIHLHVYNFGTESEVISHGEKLVQMILLPVFYDKIEEVSEDNLFENDSTRGKGGFGSTGVF